MPATHDFLWELDQFTPWTGRGSPLSPLGNSWGKGSPLFPADSRTHSLARMPRAWTDSRPPRARISPGTRITMGLSVNTLLSAVPVLFFQFDDHVGHGCTFAVFMNKQRIDIQLLDNGMTFNHLSETHQIFFKGLNITGRFPPEPGEEGIPLDALHHPPCHVAAHGGQPEGHIFIYLHKNPPETEHHRMTRSGIPVDTQDHLFTFGSHLLNQNPVQTGILVILPGTLHYLLKGGPDLVAVLQTHLNPFCIGLVENLGRYYLHDHGIAYFFSYLFSFSRTGCKLHGEGIEPVTFQDFIAVQFP